VPSLGLPEGAESVRWESLSQYEAIRLFVDRAAQVQTGFRATEENAFILAAICKRLDGIPLAIELAAARIRSLSVDEVNRRLDQRFRLLTGGSRTALPRQQTLRSLIDWSYDLLSAQEKLLLCRLSVFSGGWTVESAEHVCQGEGVDESEVLDLLTHLVDKSLVFGDERGGATRYRLLETVRQYARDRLMESTFGETWRDRHLAYFVDLADRAKPHLTGTDQQIWFDRLEVEHDNIRSALAWSSEDGGDSESGAKLAHAVTRFWLLRGYLSEGRGWCLGLLERTPEGYSRWNRANLMNGAGNLCWNLADYPKAKEMFAGAIELAREVGHTMCVSAALSNLATIIKEQGDYVTCTPLFEESVLISREIGDRYGLAMTLGNIAVIWLDQGELAKARATLEESRDILSDLGDPVGYARSLTGLGNLDCLEGHFESARSLFEEALAIQTRLGDPRGVAVTKLLLGILTLRMGDASSACAQLQEGLIGLRALGHLRHIAGSLEELAQASTCLANLPRAARTWGAAERLREVIGTPLPPFQSIQYRENVAMGRLAFGDDEGFQSAWQSGRAMTTEQAVEYALEPFYGTIDAQ
jgi:non-specific serine/threonine protein kinase